MRKVNTFLNNMGDHMTLGNVVKVVVLGVAAIAAYKKAKAMWLQREGQKMIQQGQQQGPQDPMIVGPSPQLHHMALQHKQMQEQQMQQYNQQLNPMHGVPGAPVPQMPVPPQYQQQQGQQLSGPVTQFVNGDHNSASIEQQMLANPEINMNDYFPSVPNMDEMPSGMSEDGQFYGG